jgi:plastocyanin
VTRAHHRCPRFVFIALLVVSSSIAVACGNGPGERPAAASAEKTAPVARGGHALVSGKAPAGAIVTLEPIVPAEQPPVAAPQVAAAPQVMDQFGQTFIPDTLVARQGQPVDFRNSEDVLHNVRVDDVETKETIFNVATVPFMSYTHVFDKPGNYRVSCDVHAAMRATIVVTDRPYFAVVDTHGSFRIPDVPTGSYTARLSGIGPDREQPFKVEGSQAELVFTAP